MSELAAKAAAQSRRERALIERVLRMYRAGWFPMHDDDAGVVEWVQPHRRGTIPLDGGFTVSRSLRARVRSGRFEVRTDTAFAAVIEGCAAASPGRERTWIDPTIAEVFGVLHKAGHAHSVEAWVRGADGGETLVGGLYGLALGGVFCGESMFSQPELGGTDASKVCLVHLVHHLRRRGFGMLDAQLTNEHLERFGCVEMEQEAYVAAASRLVGEERTWLPFEAGVTVREVTESRSQ